MADKDTKTKAKAKKKTGFFTGVKAEFKKISWPDQNELVKKTGIVVFISVVLGIIISVVDSAALQLFSLLIG